jgi:hypothetical protein
VAVHPKTTETNVRLPPCAFDALTAVMARYGASRDATVRRLLTEHVERQEQEDPDDRLTHISTVLRYPPPPRWRKDPRQDRPLRLRASADLLERARAVSLVLPGQYQRAFRDYQSRAARVDEDVAELAKRRAADLGLSIGDYLARLVQDDASVLEQFLFDHGDNAAFVYDYGNIDLREVRWQLETIPVANFNAMPTGASDAGELTPGPAVRGPGMGQLRFPTEGY